MSFTGRRVLFYGFATSNYFFREVVRKMLGQGHKADDLGIVFPNGQYRNFYKSILPDDHVCYLYRNYNAVYAQVRRDRNYTVIRQDFADNAFMTLAADKVGFRDLSSETQLDHLETIYRIYGDFLDRFRPDHIVFPDIEVVDAYLLHNMAKARNIPIAYYFHLRNLGRSVLGSDVTEIFPPYFGIVTEEGRTLAADFMQRTAQALPRPTYFEPPWKGSVPAPPKQAGAFIRLLRSLVLRLGPERHYRGEDTFKQKLMIFILPLLERYRNFIYRNFVRTKMQIRNLSDLPEKFYLFALQMTPESSINYLSPYYVDQIRAIDEIRMALPPGSWLVVKEHPTMMGVRPAQFYRDLRRMPGVLLADALIPMSSFQAQAEVVFTITGTVGLECLFAKRPCYMFGKNFFMNYIPGKQTDPDLKIFMRQDLNRLMQEKYDRMIADLPKIFSVTHPFILWEPLSAPITLAEGNIAAFIAALDDHFGKIEELPEIGQSGDVSSSLR